MFVYYNLILDSPLDAIIPWVPFTLKEDGGLVCLEEPSTWDRVLAVQLHRSSRTFLCRQLPWKGNPGASSEQKAASFRLRWSMVGLCSSPTDDQLLLATDLLGILSCSHWTFLTFKCWTCCFKHFVLIRSPRGSELFSGLSATGLIACSFLPPAKASEESACHILSQGEGSVTSHLIPDHTFCHPTLPPIFSVWCQQGEHSSVTLHPGFKQLLCLDHLGSSFSEPSSKEMQISWVTFAKRKRILFEVPSTVTSQCFFFPKKNNSGVTRRIRK